MNADERAAFAEALQETGLFSQVLVADDDVGGSADWKLIVGGERMIAGGSMHNPDLGVVLCMVSLGIIPAIDSGDASRDFALSRCDAANPSLIGIHVGGDVWGVGGWVALPMLAMPWWFTGPHVLERRRIEARLVAVEISRRRLLDGASTVH
jgi:hypothetical protein